MLKEPKDIVLEEFRSALYNIYKTNMLIPYKNAYIGTRLFDNRIIILDINNRKVYRYSKYGNITNRQWTSCAGTIYRYNMLLSNIEVLTPKNLLVLEIAYPWDIEAHILFLKSVSNNFISRVLSLLKQRENIIYFEDYYSYSLNMLIRNVVTRRIYREIMSLDIKRLKWFIKAFTWSNISCFSFKELLQIFNVYGDSIEYKWDKFYDYRYMRRELLDTHNFPALPNISHLQYYHDKIVEAYNKQLEIQERAENEAYTKKYLNDVYPRIKNLEYSNNTYTIIVPKDLYELVIEGRSLHHCVGSYTKSVSNGNEYILFLRHTNDLQKSFITINLDSDLRFRQIHGMCNNNIEDHQDKEEIKEFLNSWIKEKQLDFSSFKGINFIYGHL